MLRIAVDNIQAGMILARPVPLPHDPHRYLLQRDREIPRDLIPRLKQLGVLEVWVRHDQLGFLEGIIDEGLGERQREVYWQVRRNFETIMNGSAADLEFRCFQDSICQLFDYLKQNPCGNILLEKLDTFDNYLLSHSANVCYLALLLGMKLEQYLIEQRRFKSPREAKNLKDLGLGCLLHDVGKMRTPVEILNKPSRLTEDELRVMQLHPVHGYQMVSGRVPMAAAQVVLNHHQRYSGGGYPERFDSRRGEKLPPLQGTQIPIFSRIATLCDIYDAATTRRVYSSAKLPVQVLHEMRTWCRGFFDPVAERAFYQIIPPFPLGQVVTLSDGLEAVVVDFNPQYPTRPKIQGLRLPTGERVADPSLEELDLALYPDLHIASVDGQDVRPFLASQQVEDPAHSMPAMP